MTVMTTSNVELMSKLCELEILQLEILKKSNQMDARNLSVDTFDSGDTAWMISATILVLMMTTPGIMLYYSGLVRLQNVLSTAMQAYSIACLVTMLWLCFGYSLAFSPVHESKETNEIFGNTQRFWLSNMHSSSFHYLAPTIPESVFCAFHLAFAIISPSLICGAFADRMKFLSLLLCISLWHLLVYCPLAHIMWHQNGWMKDLGVLDFAGGSVVHINAGFSALVASVIVGKRMGLGKKHFHPHNMLLCITGAGLMWIGWFGFIAGSTYASDQIAGLSMLNVQIAAASGSATWMLIDLLETGKPSILGIVNGSLAGMVSVTPGAGFVDVTGAFVLGVAGGGAVCYGVRIKQYCRFDDSLDAFGVHGVAGVVGTLLTGCLAKKSICGTDGAFYGNGELLLIQLWAVLFTICWSVVGSAVIFLGVDKLIGLRVPVDVERLGLDRIEHGSSMYAQIQLTGKSNRSSPPLSALLISWLRRLWWSACGGVEPSEGSELDKSKASVELVADENSTLPGMFGGGGRRGGGSRVSGLDTSPASRGEEGGHTSTSQPKVAGSSADVPLPVVAPDPSMDVAAV